MAGAQKQLISWLAALIVGCGSGGSPVNPLQTSAKQSGDSSGTHFEPGSGGTTAGGQTTSGAGAGAGAAEKDASVAVDQDFTQLSSGERSDTRYASLAHLVDATPEQLETARFGLAKAVNSLSTAPNLVTPKAIDGSEMIFRIHLSAYNLTAANWDLLAAQPGGANATATTPGGARVARADWLVFAMTRPEAYDRIMKLPALESGLESRLGVNRAGAQYLGVATSIVAKNPRILERISINAGGSPGYYWRSYDFLLSGGARKAMQDAIPTFAANRKVTDLIAGEFIWSLPNGLQGYMLSGFGAQRRFDAVAQVAGDPRRTDRLVINGESCISCHARGLNARKDEVRPASLSPAAGKDAATQALIKTLYPEQSVLDAQFAADNAKFGAAVRALGFAETGVEPITATVNLYLQKAGLTDVRKQSGETDAVFN